VPYALGGAADASVKEKLSIVDVFPVGTWAPISPLISTSSMTPIARIISEANIKAE
jgi:hypothetical protein